MKAYYGNYVGLVISGGNEDPEYRGRTQVFIPHIMPTIYEGWNETGEDRQISITGNNLEGGLTQKEIEHLKKVLPWAECATPVVGSGPAGILDKTGNLVGELLNRGSGIVKGALAKIIGSTAPGVNPSGQPVPTGSNMQPDGKNPTYNQNSLGEKSMISNNGLSRAITFNGGKMLSSDQDGPSNPKAQAKGESRKTSTGLDSYSTVGIVVSNTSLLKRKFNITVTDQNGTSKTVTAIGYDVNPEHGIGVTSTNGPLELSQGAIDHFNDLGITANNDGTNGTGSYTIKVDPADPNTPVTPATKSAAQSVTDSVGNSTIQHPTPFPSSFGPNTNYQPTGSFGYARAGQLVWVFFQEGNPLFPVYFAASYGAAEWKNIYQSHSPAFGLTGAGNDGTNTENSFMSVHMDTGGGMRSGMSVANGTLDDEFIHEIFHKNGSNLKFSKSVVELNSMYDFKKTIMGDDHECISCNKELKIEGDFNTVVYQDTFVTIGNWDKSAQKAAEDLQKIIDESMKLKSSS
jgi:hypothetical protein